jgi:hypothetical protein
MQRECVVDALAAWEPGQRVALDVVRRIEAAVREGRRDDATREAGALRKAVASDVAEDEVCPGEVPLQHRRAAVETLASAVTAAYEAGDVAWAERAAEALIAMLRREG